MSAAMTLDIIALLPAEAMLHSVVDADTLDLMARIGIVAENAISDNFEGEHDPDGLPWLPSFRARTEGGKTLTDKGLLAGSITSNPTATEVEAGSNMIYAAIHNFGGVIKRERSFAMIADLGFTEIKMPQRQFVGWGSEAMKEAEQQAEDWLASLLPPGALS
jgi:phage virion morphogenesis protein